MSYDLGLKTLKRMCLEQNPMAWHRAKLSDALFRGPEKQVFAWVDAHVKKYHALPQIDTLVSTHPLLNAVHVPEPVLYYVEKIERAFFYSILNNANIDSQAVIKADQDNFVDAANVLRKALSTITQQQYRTKIMDVGVEAPLSVLAEYHGVGKDDLACAFGWPYMDNQSGGIVGGDVVSFVGRPAQGKAQPLDSLVLTSEGWRAMGSLRVGDSLASVDGKPSVVTAIHPQGVRKVFKVTFQDGRTVRASDEHLWEVWYRDWGAPKVLTTLQLIAKLQSKRYQGRLSVRLFSGDYGVDSPTEFSPYLLGVLLGDGCLRGNDVTFTSVDQELVEAVHKELRRAGMSLTKAGDICYRIVDDRQGGPRGTNRVRDWLGGLGLMGHKSETKFIPQSYLDRPRKDRVELLRGLMDTDGTAGKDGTVTYSSSSLVLAKQVQYLARSIGGKATIRTKKTACLDNYIIGMVLEDRSEVFTLTRKKSRVSVPRTTHTNHRLTIVDVEEVQPQECQCITVSHPSHLYVTDDFTVTHNSWMMLYIAIHNWVKKHKNVLFVSMEMAPMPIAQRIASMYAGTPYGQLKMGGYSSQTYKKFSAGLTAMQGEGKKLYVVDGNLAVGVDEVYALADLLGCDTVLIDGAYLMKHRDKRMDRFTRVAENVEQMKLQCSDFGLSTFASWQFNRQAAKLKKGEQAGLEDIGMSDSIPQISSIVLGMEQEDSVETMISRKIKVMKGRSGEIGHFGVNWDFSRMDFSEVNLANNSQIPMDDI